MAKVKIDKEFPSGNYEFSCNGIVTGIDVYGTISKDHTKKDCAQTMVDYGGDLYDGIELGSCSITITNTDTDESWELCNFSKSTLCPTLDGEEFWDEEEWPPKITDNCYILRDPEDFDEYDFFEEYEFEDGFKLSDIKFFAHNFACGRNILSSITIKNCELYFTDADGDYNLSFFIEGEEIDLDELNELANSDDDVSDESPATENPPSPTPTATQASSGNTIAGMNASLRASLEKTQAELKSSIAESQAALKNSLAESQAALKKSLEDAMKGLK